MQQSGTRCAWARVWFAIAWLSAFAAPLGAQSAPAAKRGADTTPLRGQVVQLTVHGKSLAGNLLGDPVDQIVAVYLPPGYDRSPERRYPVIYALSGYAPEPQVADARPGPRKVLVAAVDRAIRQGRLGNVIFVFVSGHNRLGGSYWVNSTATGRWEDFVVDDVVGAVDARFRTIAASDQRGLYGISMGGFGAISIAMDRPGVFGTVFAQSPCCLAPVGEFAPGPGWSKLLDVPLPQAQADFRRGYPPPLEVLALAAAFAPDVDKPPTYGDMPYRTQHGKVVANEPALSRWLAKLPIKRLDRQAAALKTLRGFRIQYGRRDSLRHIVIGTPMFDRALSAHGVSHEFHADDGGHVQRSRFRDDAIPFFARTLVGAGAKARHSKTRG